MIWRCYYVKRGGHVHCRLFCGPQEGALGLCGELSFREEEFTIFTEIGRVISMNWTREMDSKGNPAGDSDVRFAQ